jgi:hypothetical protein
LMGLSGSTINPRRWQLRIASTFTPCCGPCLSHRGRWLRSRQLPRQPCGMCRT